MDIELFTISSFYSILPTIVGIWYIKSLNKGVIALVSYQFLSNVLMLFSNINFFDQQLNTHYFFYISILISSIAYSLFFAYIFEGYKTLFFGFTVLIISIVAFDYFKNGLIEMNVLPFIFIDLFIILGCVVYWKIKQSISKPLNFLLKVILIYSVYDLIMNFVTSYFYDFLNDKIFNLIWFYINPIVGIVFYSALAYCFYRIAATKKPEFDQYADFNTNVK